MHFPKTFLLIKPLANKKSQQLSFECSLLAFAFTYTEGLYEAENWLIWRGHRTSIRKLGLQPRLYHPKAVWPKNSHLTSLNFRDNNNYSNTNQQSIAKIQLVLSSIQLVTKHSSCNTVRIKKKNNCSYYLSLISLNFSHAWTSCNQWKIIVLLID